MRSLLFATSNKHKLTEVREILEGRCQITGLRDLGFEQDIPETGHTIEENAGQKAWHIFERFHQDCFADDTGLEVEALGGQPGVYAARYAGPGCSFDDNIRKLLREMDGISNRKACFRCVISLIMDGREYQFEGRVEGEILTERRGREGFGYDPVFRPVGYDQTFAEMDAELKNSISHRALATQKMLRFLSF